MPGEGFASPDEIGLGSIARMIQKAVFRWLIAAAVVVLAAGPSLADEAGSGSAAKGAASLKGHFLVAAPEMGDPRFAKTVIYMVNHGTDGAFGLIVNKTYGSGPVADLLKGFGIEAEQAKGNIRVHYGGPVERGFGFLLHTSDYSGGDTRPVTPGVSLTTSRDALKAIASGQGPKRSIFVLGYSGWAPGQLESEIRRGDWLTAPADEALVFDEADQEAKWQRARGKAGLDL